MKLCKFSIQNHPESSFEIIRKCIIQTFICHRLSAFHLQINHLSKPRNCSMSIEDDLGPIWGTMSTVRIVTDIIRHHKAPSSPISILWLHHKAPSQGSIVRHHHKAPQRMPLRSSNWGMKAAKLRAIVLQTLESRDVHTLSERRKGLLLIANLI